MEKYDIYVGGIWFFLREATSAKKAIELTETQIENLHPLNMSEDSLEEYRNRFRNKKIEAFKQFDTKNPYK